jgi:mannose-1-phosphate guanylyltransferase
MPERYVLVVAGGRGERFWPWSRPERPKQLLPLARNGRTLLAATFERALTLVPADHVVVITAMDLIPDIRRECPGALVVGEPAARNTAPAIAAAAAWFPDDAAFSVMWADHLIDDRAAFTADLECAFAIAEREPVLVTTGVPATRPDVNLGYIRRGAPFGDRAFQVAAFEEKPDAERARRWLESGECLWNTGLFAWRRGVFMEALAVGRPALAKAFRDFSFDGTPAGFERRLGEVFPSLEAVSVDHAVLEKATNAVMIEASFDWDDLGSWGAWARHQPRDPRGNVRHGTTEVLDCDRCVVVGEGGIAAAIGLEDMVVVHAHGATLVCPVDRSEQVRRVSEAVRTRGGA